MASWGKTLGQLGEAAGVPYADILGSGVDAFTDWNQLQEDTAIRQHRWNVNNARDKWAMENYVADKQERQNLKHKLLTQSENLKSATQQINDFFGQPYAPSRAEIMQDVANLSAQYKGEVLRLAELTDSTATAKRMYKLGGADSQTAYNDISKDTVRTYTPELLQAINKAKKDALIMAEANMDLDSKTRQQYIDAYANPYGDQFNMEKSLLDNVPGAVPGSNVSMDTTAQNAMQTGATSFSDSLTDFGSRVAKIIRQQNEGNENAESTTFTTGLDNKLDWIDAPNSVT